MRHQFALVYASGVCDNGLPVPSPRKRWYMSTPAWMVACIDCTKLEDAPGSTLLTSAFVEMGTGVGADAGLGLQRVKLWSESKRTSQFQEVLLLRRTSSTLPLAEIF